MRLRWFASALLGCGGPSAHGPPPTTPTEIVVAPRSGQALEVMAGSSLTPFVREAPPVASYEAVVAAFRSDDAPKISGPELSDAQLSAPMHNAAWLAKCGVPESTKVTVRVAIRHGAPVGVSVYATPEDEAIVSCVKDYVTAVPLENPLLARHVACFHQVMKQVMKLVHAAVAPLVVALVVACGGTTSGISSDGGLDGASDGGCVTPAQGAACTTDQSACSTGDACCIGYMWSCVSSAGGNAWQKLGLGCPCRPPVDGGADAARRDAGPVVCGARTCAANEYCKTASGGAQPLDGGSNVSYSCTPIPAACFASPTCDCLKANGAGGCMCNDVDGWPSVTCNYP